MRFKHPTALPATLIGLLALAAALAPARGDEPTRLLRWPTISADQLVFSYAGDLWTTGRAGGEARRLTSAPALESYCALSPDSKLLAFSAEHGGNLDVYVMPAAGGEPRRLTFHPAADRVVGWRPDGGGILFASSRFSVPSRFDVARLFVVAVGGGLPELLPMPRSSVFHRASFSPDGKRLAYNPLSGEAWQWRSYRGGATNAVGIFDLEAIRYQELPRSDSNDVHPLWYGEAIYFVSDRDLPECSGVMNLYRFDLKTQETRRLTELSPFGVETPSLGPDAIVFTSGGLIHELDLRSEELRQIPVVVPREQVTPVARPGPIHSWAIAPDGRSAIIGAGGDVFVVAVDGSARNLSRSPGVREIYPTFSPDAGRIAYLSDRDGEYELWLRPATADGEQIRLTRQGPGYRFAPVWSPDGRSLAWWDAQLRLWIVDVDRRQPQMVARHRGMIHQLEPVAFSPDGRWLAFSLVGKNFRRSIHLYSLDRQRSFRVTETFYDDRSPVFDPRGRYLFFVSDRFFEPTDNRADWDFAFVNMAGILALTLRRDVPSPLAPRRDGEEDTAVVASPEPLRIDLEGIEQRVVSLPLPPGNYASLSARPDRIFYLSRGLPPPLGEARTAAALHVYDLVTRRDQLLLDGIRAYDVDRAGERLLYRWGDAYGIVPVAEADLTAGRLATAQLPAEVEPRAQWRQIFHEAWRLQRDFFFDPAMGGHDWEAIRRRYEPLLPWVAHRFDLNLLIRRMFAELSTSHVAIWGPFPDPDPERGSVGLLGVDFAADGAFYRLARIYRGESWNPDARAPLAEPGMDVAQGDYLMAVDGRPLRTPENPYAAFQGLADKVVELLISPSPRIDYARRVLVRPVGSEAALRYLAWVESNRRRVEDATGGRIGYVHLPDTSAAGVGALGRSFHGLLDREGLIIDVRDNMGGWTPTFLMEKLTRRRIQLLSPGAGEDVPWPRHAIPGPRVMIINELAASGGDDLPYYFRLYGAGPLVGTQTTGANLGMLTHLTLMDGAGLMVPEYGFRMPEDPSRRIPDGTGVEPDYEVLQRPDLVARGRDPQLDKASELALAGLRSP